MREKSIHRTAAAAIAALLASLALPSCESSAPFTREGFALGTACRVSVYGRDAPKAVDAAFKRLADIEARMSANSADSEVALVSANAGRTPVAVSEDTYFVLGVALEYARLTDGAFDPTVGPLVKLWGIGTDRARVPSREEIDAARALVGYRDVETEDAARKVFLKRVGMSLDLGAIAKGYAADQAASILREGGVKRAIIDLGGNVYVVGSKAKAKPFRIGIQDPARERNRYIGILPAKDLTLVTSGAYERFFTEGGKRYHHILDIATGYPADSGLVSVTIIAPESIRADALSTSVFILGRERGSALLAGQAGVSAILVSADGTIDLLGPGAADFEFTGTEGYRMGTRP
jgi:FAD:protein FMN transferase